MERIKFENISKKFKIGYKRQHSFLEMLLSIFSGKKSKRTIYALKNVSLNVKSGEILGVIGKNGSGKSTMLRIISGIYKKDNGKLDVNGNVISLIGLGIGLKERLTMKENIFLVGSLFGMNYSNIKSNYNLIVNFSGLEDFISTKIYQFSEGMKQRLAFSIAIHSDPDILLLDEVFEIGDDNFRGKSVKKINELAGKGVSIIFVSHDLDMIGRNCDGVIWLDDGRVVKRGNTKEIISEFKNN